MLDATGKLVFPGGVEPHAHIHEPMHKGWSQGREVWLQPPEGATRAALFGGTTTVVSFAFMDVHVSEQEFDASLAVEHRRRIFDARSYADFAFHPVFTGTPTRRDDGLDRGRGRRRHGDVQVLHDRPHDDADGHPPRQRLVRGRCSRSARGSARWRWCTPRTTT